MSCNNLFYLFTVLAGAIVYGVVDIYWMSHHDNLNDQDDEAYLDGLLRAASKPRPPKSQRKLSNIHDPRQRSYHLRLFDLDKDVAENSHTIDCIMTQTSQPFHICIHPTYRDKYISLSLWESGVWEPYITPIIQRGLNKYPDAIFVDIGANIGYYTLMAAKMGHQVIAVEPAHDNFVRLHKGAQLNKLTHKIWAIFNAMSDSHENATLIENSENQGGIRVRPISRSEAERIVGRGKGHKVIKTTTIDHLLELGDISQAILKIDIGKLHSIRRGRLGVGLCDIMLLYSAATYVSLVEDCQSNVPHAENPCL